MFCEHILTDNYNCLRSILLKCMVFDQKYVVSIPEIKEVKNLIQICARKGCLFSTQLYRHTYDIYKCTLYRENVYNY